MKKDARVMQIAAACSENHGGPFFDAFFRARCRRMVRFFRIGCFPTPTRLSERFYEKKVVYLLFRIARRNTGKTTYLEKSHHTASSVASEAVQCPRLSFLEHVTWWPTPWEPFHHSLELANENCLARGPKNGPVRGDHF